MTLGTGKSRPICKMLLFLMSNEDGGEAALKRTNYFKVWKKAINPGVAGTANYRGPCFCHSEGPPLQDLVNVSFSLQKARWVTALTPLYYPLVSHAVSQQTMCKKIRWETYESSTLGKRVSKSGWTGPTGGRQGRPGADRGGELHRRA